MKQCSSYGSRAVVSLLAGLGIAAAFATSAAQAEGGNPMQMQMMHKLVEMAPYRGYLAAHDKEQHPLGILGGPISVTIAQKTGGVFVSLPDKRRLDPDVFGTPKMPRAFAGTPGIDGVPPMARGVADGHYTNFEKMSPFGDKYIVMADGKLSIQALDATATDAATTQDRVKMMASWKDKAGNVYEVRCCKMLAAHGIEYPTFGGVVTNQILHGSSRIGTSLMPTEYTYFAFWGMGQVLKNGKVVAAPRLIHGMLTEYVRTTGYKLAFDSQVTPTRLQFHLMVPPFMPDMAHGDFKHDPLPTGFKLPNGMQLPFWHVMFENLDIHSHRA